MIFLYFSVRIAVRQCKNTADLFGWLSFVFATILLCSMNAEKNWPEKSKVRTIDDREKYIRKAQTILNPLV